MEDSLNQGGVDLLNEFSEGGGGGFTREMEDEDQTSDAGGDSGGRGGEGGEGGGGGGGGGGGEGGEGGEGGGDSGAGARASPRTRMEGFFPDDIDGDADFRAGRAPMDTADDDEFCFPSVYGEASVKGVVGMGRVDHTDAIKFINSAITRMHGNGSRLGDIIEFISNFYTSDVQTAYPTLPAWTKESIRRYILLFSPQDAAEDRQLVETINSVYACIEALRANVCVSEGGRSVPDLKTMKQLAELAKTHSTLVAQRKARAQN